MREHSKGEHLTLRVGRILTDRRMRLGYRIVADGDGVRLAPSAVVRAMATKEGRRTMRVVRILAAIGGAFTPGIRVPGLREVVLPWDDVADIAALGKHEMPPPATLYRGLRITAADGSKYFFVFPLRIGLKRKPGELQAFWRKHGAGAATP